MQTDNDMLANGDGHAWAPPEVAGNGHDGRGAFGRLRPSLASLMVEEGVATSDQLEEALTEGKETGERLGEVVVRRGWINEAGLAELLARQWDLTFVALSMITVEEAARTLISRDAALRLGACPIGFKDGAPLVTVADPNEERFAAVRERLGDCAFIVTTPSALSWLIDQTAEIAEPEVAPVVAMPTLAPVELAPAEPVEDPAAHLEPALQPFEHLDPAPEPVVEHLEPEPAPLPAEPVEPPAPLLPDPAAEVLPAPAVRVQPEPADESGPALTELDRLVDRLVSERSHLRDELDGYRRRLAELGEEKARVEESLRAVEAHLGDEDRMLDSMRSKLSELS
jgi:MshEN domain